MRRLLGVATVCILACLGVANANTAHHHYSGKDLGANKSVALHTHTVGGKNHTISANMNAKGKVSSLAHSDPGHHKTIKKVKSKKKHGITDGCIEVFPEGASGTEPECNAQGVAYVGWAFIVVINNKFYWLVIWFPVLDTDGDGGADDWSDGVPVAPAP